MQKRTRKAFTLLELIVVVVVLGILALVAVPSFKGVIDNSRGSVAENTAASIARDANALAAFNSGAAANETDNANIDAATAELGLNTADGWVVDTGDATDGADIALTKNGSSDCYTISVTAGSPDRATVAAKTTGTVTDGTNTANCA